MNIVSLSLRLLEPRARAFERATKNPMSCQNRVLAEYLRRNRDTEYGIKHNFKSIRTTDDYKKNVPISDCETMRPYLERIARGEKNLLMRDNPVFFGATSGTASAVKLIPSTKYSEAKKNELMELWSYHINRDHPAVTNGKIFAIISPEVEGYTPSGIPYGAESGYGYRRLPGVIKHIYALPYEVFEIKDYDARYYAMLRISMAANITNIATLNPGTLILLAQKIDKWQSMIIADIEKGTLNGGFDIPDSIRRCIKLKADPDRADALRMMLARNGSLLPRYFWPNLELIECWKGGSMKMYLKQLPGYFGDIPIRDMGCLSTEARSSIPLSDEGAGGVLAIMTNFFEFIPKDEIDNKGAPALLCSEIEVGKEYFIIVTTPGGLYRYNIDDVIRVNGFYNNTPVIEFVQKGLATSSLSGEKLYESQVNNALTNVLRKTGLFVKFFCAIPKHASGPHYEFLTEFSNSRPTMEQKKDFLRKLDEELGRENREYLYTRQSQTLSGPVLKIAEDGEYERYRVQRIQQGAHDGQFKIADLSLDNEFDKSFNIAETLALD